MATVALQRGAAFDVTVARVADFLSRRPVVVLDALLAVNALSVARARQTDAACIDHMLG